MLKLYVDFNDTDDINAVNLRLDATSDSHISVPSLSIGQRILVYDEETQCEAIVCKGAHRPWVAKLLRDTIQDITLENGKEK